MQCPSQKAVPSLYYFKCLLEAVFHQIKVVNIQKRLGTQHRKEVGENPSDDDTERRHNDAGCQVPRGATRAPGADEQPQEIVFPKNKPVQKANASEYIGKIFR